MSWQYLDGPLSRLLQLRIFDFNFQWKSAENIPWRRLRRRPRSASRPVGGGSLSRFPLKIEISKVAEAIFPNSSGSPGGPPPPSSPPGGAGTPFTRSCHGNMGLLLDCGVVHVPAGALRVARVCYRELRAPRTRRCGDPSLLPSPHDGSAFLEASLLFVHFLGTPSLPPVLLPSGDGNAFLAGHICAPATHVARFRQLSCPPLCHLPNAVGLRAITLQSCLLTG